MTEKCIFRLCFFLKSYSCVLQTFYKDISLVSGKTITQTKATKPQKSVNKDFLLQHKSPLLKQVEYFVLNV